MRLYELFSRGPLKKGGTRGNCLIRLTQYPPLFLINTQLKILILKMWIL